MEAKVDVRKLQVLNDRINQTIDALNQVRFSVHGLGHTSGPPSPYGLQSPFGIGTQGGYPGVGGSLGGFPGVGGSLGGFQQGGLGGAPWMTPGLGFQHNPYQQFQNPFYQQLPIPFPQVMNPWSSMGSPWMGAQGIGAGYGGGFGGGLFHSPPDFIERQLAEVRANDPYRISKTFPFAI